MDNQQPQTVVRLSLRWVFFGLIIVLVVGILGGFIGTEIGTPRTPLLTSDQGKQLITTVQEVTISPNMLIQDVIDQQERSVLLLAHGDKENPTIISTAVAVTSDGVLAALHPDTRDEVFAIDSSGTYVPLQSLGRDSVYGITFYKVQDAVFPLLELSSSDPHVGTTLVALSRSATTIEPVAQPFEFTQYVLPTANDPVAWHRLGQTATNISFLPGTPLLTDEGKIAAITVDSNGKRLIPISYLRRSLDRLAAGNREQDPYTDLGLSITPTFTANEGQTGISFAFTVTRLSSNTPASGLRVGDQIVAINSQEVTWQADITNLLSLPLPITVTVNRAGQEQDITLTEVSR